MGKFLMAKPKTLESQIPLLGVLLRTSEILGSDTSRLMTGGYLNSNAASSQL